MTQRAPLSDSEVARFEAQLLAEVPPQVFIGNGALRRKLGWDEVRYWYIRNRLLQAGHLQIGRGRGGSVQRAVRTESAVETPPPVPPSPLIEADLYAPIISTLRSHWVPDHEIQDCVIQQTAHQGRRDTGGKWTRPDITLASSNTYIFVPGRPVELRTFEVKTYDGLDVTAVYEALAHRRAAHYAYVLAHVPESQRGALESLLERLIADAQQHGISFVVVADPSDYESWDIEVEPRRSVPNPADLDNFIRMQTNDEFKQRILTWCKAA